MKNRFLGTNAKYCKKHEHQIILMLLPHFRRGVYIMDIDPKSLYYLYEYTDEDVMPYDDNPAYPHLENYVKTCILTKEVLEKIRSGGKHG